MLHSSTQNTEREKRLSMLAIGLVIFETILVTLALVPAQEWTRLLPGSTSATIPAWIGLGLFVIAAASKVGAFYLVSPTQVTSNVSVLELFAALGGIGWLGRHIFKL